ncbi:hypothetical protein [uncultured Flavobacterium sp.]|uniref:hypothetical protein n=1 Tax=uncultured Flavobacterium sp. TaxID=165435 RepID=UPI0030CA4047|tara:strand:+ start:6900 stop:7229 length:330 start_codon:yes stop_codon:yes gene_type:complete
MIHRGEIIKEKVYKSGFSITKLAVKLNKSRGWVYQMFENSNVSLDVALDIGKVIQYDFSKDILELRSNDSIQNNSITSDKSDLYWKDKYISLLEDYTELLKNPTVNSRD